MEHEWNVRLMELRDIEQIAQIERDSFTLPWSEQAFYNELTNNLLSHYLVIEDGDQIVGYGGMWTIIDEAHITNIAVRSGYRGLGLGERILRELKATAKYLGMKKMLLEVRISNEIAQNLYLKLGFEPSGTRKKYYSDNNEDALIMTAEL